MYDIKLYEQHIKNNLSQYRYHHSMCVAKKAKELAKKYNLDEEKAYVAGVLHDVTKEFDLNSHIKELDKIGLKFSEIEKQNNKVHHQISGSAFVQSHFNISDFEIINAIRYHTTGRENMTLFEMIIYLADFTSEDRDYKDVDVMRELVEKNLYEAMIYSLKHTINSVVNSNRQLHPDTLNCYNWAIKMLNR